MQIMSPKDTPYVIPLCYGYDLNEDGLVLFFHQAGKDVDFTDTQTATVSIFKIVSKEYTGKRKPKM